MQCHSEHFFFCKTGFLLRGTSFVPLGYRCLSGLTATKCSLAFQRLQWTKNAPSGPAPSWKLLFIINFDSYLATSLTKFDVRFCRVDPPVEVDGWRVSSCFRYSRNPKMDANFHIKSSMFGCLFIGILKSSIFGWLLYGFLQRGWSMSSTNIGYFLLSLSGWNLYSTIIIHCWMFLITLWMKIFIQCN